MILPKQFLENFSHYTVADNVNSPFEVLPVTRIKLFHKKWYRRNKTIDFPKKITHISELGVKSVAMDPEATELMEQLKKYYSMI